MHVAILLYVTILLYVNMVAFEAVGNVSLPDRW